MTSLVCGMFPRPVKKSKSNSGICARGGTDARGGRIECRAGAVTLLAAKTAVITGGASGIGRAIAERAAQAGARLVLGDVDTEALARTAEDLLRQGAAVEWRRCDVRRSSDIDQLVQACRARFGDPDVLFANAGIEGKLAAPWEVTDEDFLNVLDVNLAGIFRAMRAVLPSMVARRSGAIVATASVAGLVGAGGLTAYVASKHGVVGLVRSVAISVAKTGVRVNALCPGMVDTALLRRLIDVEPSIRESLLALKPMGRLGELPEIAGAAVWLASSEASFITGHALAVDGGYAAQ
jgi:NAD(P)-dependent dehydrogenase (short-subunit alcohol dehydrogenase family)